MAVTAEIFDALMRHGAAVRGTRMMEFGSQEMAVGLPAGEASQDSAKTFFSSRGVEHISIDLNEQRGSLAFDLGESINKPEWRGYFDFVTDVGTTEHVYNLFEARCNAHVFCKMGGLCFFQNPLIGHWPDHGLHYFTEEFYRALAMTGVVEIVELFTHPTFGDAVTQMQVLAIVRKTREEFVSPWEFAEICKDTVRSFSSTKNEMPERQQTVIPMPEPEIS